MDHANHYPPMSKEQRKRASAKIAKMMEKDEAKPRDQIIAIGLRMAREGQLGPRGGYEKE